MLLLLCVGVVGLASSTVMEFMKNWILSGSERDKDFRIGRRYTARSYIILKCRYLACGRLQTPTHSANKEVVSNLLNITYLKIHKWLKIRKNHPSIPVIF